MIVFCGFRKVQNFSVFIYEIQSSSGAYFQLVQYLQKKLDDFNFEEKKSPKIKPSEIFTATLNFTKNVLDNAITWYTINYR